MIGLAAAIDDRLFASWAGPLRLATENGQRPCLLPDIAGRIAVRSSPGT